MSISSKDIITLRLETFPATQTEIDCKVQTISGPSPNEYENVGGPEEESLEDLASRSLKSTTCECGKINLPNKDADAIVFPEDDDVCSTICQ